MLVIVVIVIATHGTHAFADTLVDSAHGSGVELLSRPGDHGRWGRWLWISLGMSLCELWTFQFSGRNSTR